jgi:hypothetical protein
MGWKMKPERAHGGLAGLAKGISTAATANGKLSVSGTDGTENCKNEETKPLCL